MNSILEIRNLHKSYYDGIPALDNVNLSIKAGEIHGIVGANGSGKTTLMNILFGNSVIHKTGGYQGEIYYQGKRVRFNNCGQAIRQGFGMIHQEFALLPDMTVGENIKLGREETLNFTNRLLGRQRSFVDTKRNNDSAKRTLRQLGIELDPAIMVVDLSINLKQFVEIAREINRTDLKLLILDEPTAVLNKNDALKLIDILKEMSRRGIAVIFISHRLEEVEQICDRVTVLRDGKVVSQYDRNHIIINQLAQDMVGHIVSKATAVQREIDPQPVVGFRDFSVDMPGEEIKGVDLTVYKGEILGLTSLSGHGKLALGYGIMGMFPVQGQVFYQNEPLRKMDAKANILKGMYVLPDDRRGLGILADQSLENNIIFSGNQIKNMFTRESLFPFLGLIDRRKTSAHVNQMIRDFDIKCVSIKQKVKELSGGNQQKVCIARALTVDPQVLFVAEPTRGVDISAKERILGMLLEINRARNTTIIIVSSELDELKRVCDRIAVMVQGKQFRILSPQAPDIDFGLALSGQQGVGYEEL